MSYDRAAAKPAAKKPDLEGGGDFNPRITPAESARTLAPEVQKPFAIPDRPCQIQPGWEMNDAAPAPDRLPS